jgi:hypothetical protein
MVRKGAETSIVDFYAGWIGLNHESSISEICNWVFEKMSILDVFVYNSTHKHYYWTWAL